MRWLGLTLVGLLSFGCPEKEPETNGVIQLGGAGGAIQIGPKGIVVKGDNGESVVIGDPDRCGEKMERYAALGIDRLMCLMQFGALPPERVLTSIRTAGEVLVPRFGS